MPSSINDLLNNISFYVYSCYRYLKYIIKLLKFSEQNNRLKFKIKEKLFKILT